MVLSIGRSVALGAVMLTCLDLKGGNGPDGMDRPYVEFDFTPVPEKVGHRWKYTLVVTTADKDVGFETFGELDVGFRRPTLLAMFHDMFDEAGFEAEVVDGNKIRVYGCTQGGGYYPVASGKFESKDLTKAQLPKVKVYPLKKA